MLAFYVRTGTKWCSFPFSLVFAGMRRHEPDQQFETSVGEAVTFGELAVFVSRGRVG